MAELAVGSSFYCKRCHHEGYRNSIRLQVKRSMESAPNLFHAHRDDELRDILEKLQHKYTDIWNAGKYPFYYFYLDMGAIYYRIGNSTFLKGNRL
jgi:hypothetical protein